MAEFERIRPINLPQSQEVYDNDIFVIDSETGGVRKIPKDKVLTKIDDTLTETGQAADAKTVGDELNNINDTLDENIPLIQNPTKTVSGSIAHFTDGADMPAESVVVSIEPVQSGTGTPSPSNVRPITGWDDVSVYVSGVNVWDEEWRNGYYNGSNGEYVYNSSQICNTNPISVKPSTAYYLKTPSNLRVVFYRNDMSFIRATITGSGVFNTPDDCCFVGFNTFQNPPYPSGSTYGHDISINYPSTDHEYHAYNGTTTTTALGRTVYGGTLDVVSGVLTAYPFYPSYNGETLNGRWICDRAVYAEGTTPPTGSQVALISGTGTTYQLTPTQISTLLGENNVWADAGAVEVTYRKDINIVIDELTNAIVSLGSNV